MPPTKPELEAKLFRYRDLARQYHDAVSTENMKQATDELERQIRALQE